MKALAIREKLLAIRRRRVEVLQAVDRVVLRIGSSPVDMVPFGKACLLARDSAFKAMRNRLKRRGVWTAVQEHLARERFDELYDAACKRQARAFADPAQLSFPDFDRLPMIRIDGQGVYER